MKLTVLSKTMEKYIKDLYKILCRICLGWSRKLIKVLEALHDYEMQQERKWVNKNLKYNKNIKCYNKNFKYYNL